MILSPFTVSTDDPYQADSTSEQILLEFEQPNDFHNSRMLAFGPDGMLYTSSGDGGGNPNLPAEDPQNPNPGLGAIFRLGPDLPPPHVPPDNPFGNPTWHYGLLNPWRFSFDAVTGELSIGDVGAANRGEVNRVADGAKGLNFGSPEPEGTGAVTPECEGLGSEPPLLEFDPVSMNTVIGGYVYRSDQR